MESSRHLLNYDPFAGDKDDDGWKRERAEVVRARRDGTCLFNDPHPYKAGTQVVRYSAVQDGVGWRSFTICADCINAWLAEQEANDE